jgi:prevent-host-death family protein
MVSQASIAEARAELSALVNKVAYAGERVILTSRGRPKAALVSLEDLEALGDLPATSSRLAALRAADELVEEIRRARGGQPTGQPIADAAEDLHAGREERMRALTAAGDGRSLR